jgi:GDP-L-fucose synthase
MLDLSTETILVTGSGGVLGTALHHALAKRGLTKVATPTRTECDLLNEADVRRYWAEVQPSLVFHLAGWVAGIQGNMSFPAEALYANARINLNVIEASRIVGAKKVVCAGTTAIYSDQVSRPMREDDLWLGAPHGSEAPYGHAKRFALAQLEAYKKQYGIDFAYLICTNLYGPNDRFDEIHGHVVPSLIARFYRAKAEQAADIVIWGDGRPTRDFLFAADAANAFVSAAERGDGAYNLATGSNHTIRTLAETLKEVSGFAGQITWDTSKPLGQLDRSYDVSRLQALGWTAETSLSDGLRQTFEWYAGNLDKVRR